MRRYALLSAILCLALLAGLIAAMDPARLVKALSAVSAGHIVAAMGAVQIQIIASAWRWRFTAERLGHTIPLSIAIREYYVSSALNLVLPGGMAGDAFRAYRSRTEGQGGWKRPAAAVMLERLSGQMAFFLLAGIGLLVWPFFLTDHMPSRISSLFWILSTLLAIALALGLVVMLRAKWMPTWLQERMRVLGPELAAVFWQDRAWLIQAGLSLLIIGGYVATFLIASDAVNAPLPVVAAMTVIPLCLLTMLIPAGVGGWGTREAAAAALWPLFGFAASQGLAASLLYGLLSLVGAGIPGLILVGLALLQGRIGRA